jgi:putative ABC transport system permease protein
VTFTRLAMKDLARNPFRSWMVFLCAALVAGLCLATVLIERGSGDAVRLTQQRLGADILVVPRDAEAKVESALLMGTPSRTYMAESAVAKVRAVPGVAAASPQLYLTTLSGASCCSVSSMFMVAYDPATDFTIQPWLKKTLGGGLKLGEVVGGTYIFVPAGEENIKIFNYILTLKSNLQPTGGALDQSMFLTMDTARDVARLSKTRAVKPLVIPDGKVSSVLVKVSPGTDPQKVAASIMKQVPEATPVLAPKMFGTFRGQMSSMTSGLVLILGLTIGLSLLLVAVVFSMATHERRREIGVLRALGAGRGQVAGSLVIQAVVLAAAGGATGIALAGVGVYLFHDLIVKRAGFPFMFPSLSSLLPLVAAGLSAAIAAAVAASFLPALRTSMQDPSLARRE